MTQPYDISLILILPAALRDAGNRLSCAMGQDTMPGNTFSVPLSADGLAPATHYGCCAWSQAGFVETLMAARQGTLLPQPPAGGDWADYGLNPSSIAAILSALIARTNLDPEPYAGKMGGDLFDTVLEAEGLVRVVEESGT